MGNFRNHDDNNNSDNNNATNNRNLANGAYCDNTKSELDDNIISSTTTTTTTTTSVIFVLKRDAKTVKNILEQRGWIDKDYRISSAQKEAFDPSSCSADDVAATDDDDNDDSVSYRECLAIPVLPSFRTNMEEDKKDTDNDNDNDNGFSDAIRLKILGQGKQSCPFSSSVLGNPQKRLQLIANRQQQQQQSSNSNNSMAQPQKQQQQQQDWSPLKQALLLSIETFLLKKNGGGGDDETLGCMWRNEIEKLDSTVCPTKVEFLGDDHNLVLSPLALRMDDLKKFLFQEQRNNSDEHKNANDPLLRLTDDTNCCMDLFMEGLWNQVAKIYQCPRILRKGGVDPNSRIRQTGYQLLWSPPTLSADTDNQHTGDPTTANNWITVTEQGIHQSFDVTKVMFSRGNISEKIRFGTQLVQPNDVVLDLYAGIGYYTLPALILGHASYVYSCEWNPDALNALRRNLHDNHVPMDKVTIVQGDCRDLILPSIRNVRPINRVSLGLLPSSEGSWKIAIQAIIGTLPNSSEKQQQQEQQQVTATTATREEEPDAPLQPPPTTSQTASSESNNKGGWLHVHGNVPVKERDAWAKWLVCKLYNHVLKELSSMRSCVGNSSSSNEDKTDSNWIVICHHVEKVKSFAPTVNHYVADVFVGPRRTTTTTTTSPEKLPCHPMHSEQQREALKEALAKDDNTDPCLFYSGNTKRFEACCLETILAEPPSCALSVDGVLHQEWMMAKE